MFQGPRTFSVSQQLRRKQTFQRLQWFRTEISTKSDRRFGGHSPNPSRCSAVSPRPDCMRRLGLRPGYRQSQRSWRPSSFSPASASGFSPTPGSITAAFPTISARSSSSDGCSSFRFTSSPHAVGARAQPSGCLPCFASLQPSCAAFRPSFSRCAHEPKTECPAGHRATAVPLNADEQVPDRISHRDVHRAGVDRMRRSGDAT